MGGAESVPADNDELIDKLKAQEYIKSPVVEKVFRLIDRGNYIKKEDINLAYRENAWRSGNLHMSAPCIYAQVMEGLELGPAMSFLNLGSGTGYLSTIAGLVLGPRGINHGVELHSDVIAYAVERMNWFYKNSPAIDVCNFCSPQFVQGNAMCLSEDVPLYDRVYCGASCPSSHEQYMKKLVKVGGVLVMPYNDQLLKVTRTDENSWSTTMLLPVSFSSLIMPDFAHPPSMVKLPEVKLHSLQELCRHAVRTILRSIIDQENLELRQAFIHSVTSNSGQGRRGGGSRISVSADSRPSALQSAQVTRLLSSMIYPFEPDQDDSDPSEGEESFGGNTLYVLFHSSPRILRRTLEARREGRRTNIWVRSSSESAEAEEEASQEVSPTRTEQEKNDSGAQHADSDSAVEDVESEEMGNQSKSDGSHSDSSSCHNRDSSQTSCQNSSSPESIKNSHDKGIHRLVGEMETNTTSCGEQMGKVANTSALHSQEPMETENSESGFCQNSTSTAQIDDIKSCSSLSQPVEEDLPKKADKRVKFDSGIGDELDGMPGLVLSAMADSSSSDSDSPAQGTSPACGQMESETYQSADSASDANVTAGSESMETKASVNHLSDGSKEAIDHTASDRTFSEENGCNDTDNEAAKDEEHMECDEKEPKKEKAPSPALKYKELMENKILRLPLPTPLKLYINYNRIL